MHDGQRSFFVAPTIVFIYLLKYLICILNWPQIVRRDGDVEEDIMWRINSTIFKILNNRKKPKLQEGYNDNVKKKIDEATINN